MIRCRWSPAFSIIEKYANNNNFYDYKIPIGERIPTFEGAVHLSKTEAIVSKAVMDDINNAIKQI